MEATPALVRELAPTGRLRTTINLGNVVLAQRDEAPANWVALRFVGRPVQDAIAGPRSMTTMGGVVLEGHFHAVAGQPEQGYPPTSLHQHHCACKISRAGAHLLL